MSFTQRHARVNISSMVRFLSLSFKLYGPVYSYRNFFLQGSNGTQTCPEDSGDRKGKRPLGRRQDVCTRGKYCVIIKRPACRGKMSVLEVHVNVF